MKTFLKSNPRLSKAYFSDRDALFIAEDLIGKTLVRVYDDGREFRSKIVETEAYLGSQDLANHASKGMTKRTKIMFDEGGLVYVYLIYGRYWLLNIVTGSADIPQAVLIRGVENCTGPGRLGRLLELDKSFYAECLEDSDRIWIESSSYRKNIKENIKKTPRIGVDYAGPIWKEKPWRFVLEM